MVVFIKQKVNELIQMYGTRDPWELANYLGYPVLELPLGSTCMGMTLPILSKKIIIINDSRNKCSKKGTLSHELYHRLFNELFGYYFMCQHTLLNVNKEERYADIFAAELLISDEDMQQLYEEKEEYIAYQLNVPVELVKIKTSYYKAQEALNEVESVF